MAPKSGIIAGKTVIVVQVQESIDKALSTISTKLNKFSNGVGRLGLELFGGGLVSGALSNQITDTFKNFEDAILFLQTKLNATEKEFAALEDRIRQLGRTTSFTAKEVAEAATVLAQGGLNATETINSLQATLDLARAGQVTLTQSGDILINTMRSFGIETTKAAEVASQFIAAARLGTLDILNLKESIKEVLGTVRILNIDLPTTLALLTQMAERSLKGTKAGTSLNTALLNLASKRNVLKETLGINLPDNLDGDRFILFLEQLYDKINKLGNLKRVAILQQLFNIRGGRAITALDDLKKIVDLQKQIRGAGNESRKAAILMDSGFGGSVRRATSAIESLSITIGRLFAKGFTPILETVPALSASLEKLAEANEGLLIPIALIPPALIGVGAGLLTFSFLGAKVAGVVGILSNSFHGLTNVLISGLNGQLVLLNKTFGAFTNKVARSGKGSNLSKKGGIFQRVDEGLSALLLSPQKVKKGASAGKIRPTSFFGRVGSAEIRTLAVFKKVLNGISIPLNLLRTGFGKLTPVINLFVSTIRSINTALTFNGKGEMGYRRILKGLNETLSSATSNLGRLKAAFASVNGEIAAGVTRLDKYNKLAEQYERQALAAVSAQDRQTLLANQLKKVDTEFNQLAATPVTGKRDKETKRQEAARRRQLALLGRQRKQIKTELDLGRDGIDPDDLAKRSDYYKALAIQERENIELQRKKRSGFALSLRQQTAEATLAKKQLKSLKEARSKKNAQIVGGFLKNISKAPISGIKKATLALDDFLIGETKFTKLLGSSSKAGLGGLKNVFGKGIRLLFSGIKALPKLLDSSVTGLFKFFKAAGGLAAGLFRIANGIRKFVFSISGVLTIIELLIAFGPKIGFIRDAFSRLGDGLSNAGKTLSGTFEDLAPVFKLFRASFGNIFAGEGELGISGLIKGFGLLADIVKNNLKIAFLQVVEAVAPLYDFLRRITLSLIEVVKLVGSIFGATLGNLGGAIQGLTGGGAGGLLGSIVETIKSAFSPENIKAAFSFVGSVLIEMARIVNKTIQDVFIVMNNLASFIQNAVVKLFEFIYKAMIKAAEALPQQLSALKNGLFAAAGAGELITNAMRPEADANAKAGQAIVDSFTNTSKTLDGIFDNFLNRLANIFSFDTEANAQAGIAAAQAAKEAAQAEAAKQTKIQEQANTPFGKVGQFLAGLNSSLPRKLVDAGLGGAAALKRQPFDFLQFGKTVLDAGQAFAKTADPKTLREFERTRLQDERKRLNQRLSGVNKILPFEELLLNTEKVEELTTLRRETVNKLKENAASLAALGPKNQRGFPTVTPGSLRDIVSATVGTFEQTRGNLLKIAGGKTMDQKQLEVMQQVVTNTGGPTDNVFTQVRDLATRAQPFVFQ